MLPDFYELKESPTQALVFEDEPPESRTQEYWRERFEISDRNYRLLESNYRNLLEENSLLARSLHESSIELKALKFKDSKTTVKGFGNEELRRDNEILARKCQDLMHSISLEESKIKDFNEKNLELNSLILLLMSENERLHGIIEEFYSQNRGKLSESIEVIGSFNDQIALQEEVMRWKARYYEIERNFSEMSGESGKIKENIGAILRENEELILRLKESESEMQRLRESLKESESLAILVNEIKEKMRILISENERLKGIIMKRCRDMASETWNF